MAGEHTQVIDQLFAFDGVALVEDVFVDRPRRAHAALLGNFLQHLAQLVFLLGRSICRQWQGEQQAQGRGDETQHESLLVR
ncbi:hypothetical protein D9M71_761190 [compost metagenome]